MRVAAVFIFALFATWTSANSIWHISGDREFYLFGTFHALRADTYPLPAAYDRTFSQCQSLWLEADVHVMADPAVARQVQSLMAAPGGKRLHDLVSDAAYAALSALAAEVGVPLAALQNLKPWAAVNLLTLTLFQQHGFDVDKGLDLHLEKQARAADLPLNYFESIIWQMTLFDDLGRQYPDDFVELNVSSLGEVYELVDALYSGWQRGDVEALYELAEFERYRPLEEALLTRRNNAWMKRLLASDGGTQCVAVGVIHMASDQGLLSQFKNAGYTVTQIH